MGVRFSAFVRTGCGAHLASYTQEYRAVFPGAKNPRRGVNHPPSSSDEAKERVEPYIYLPFRPFIASYRTKMFLLFGSV
jgi:hypothetical protein